MVIRQLTNQKNRPSSSVVLPSSRNISRFLDDDFVSLTTFVETYRNRLSFINLSCVSFFRVSSYYRFSIAHQSNSVRDKDCIRIEFKFQFQCCLLSVDFIIIRRSSGSNQPTWNVSTSDGENDRLMSLSRFCLQPDSQNWVIYSPKTVKGSGRRVMTLRWRQVFLVSQKY